MFYFTAIYIIVVTLSRQQYPEINVHKGINLCVCLWLKLKSTEESSRVYLCGAGRQEDTADPRVIVLRYALYFSLTLPGVTLLTPLRAERSRSPHASVTTRPRPPRALTLLETLLLNTCDFIYFKRLGVPLLSFPKVIKKITVCSWVGFPAQNPEIV